MTLFSPRVLADSNLRIMAGTTKWLGVLPAFLILSVLYSAVSLVLALLAVRVYERRTGNGPSRFARWLEHQGESQRSGWVRKLLLSGKVVGFVLSSFLIGGIVTTFLIRYSGRTDRITSLAILSSVLFGVTFVGFYSGIGRIAFGH